MSKVHRPVSTYEDIAGEYYDPVRHPTCANFSELSSQFLDSRMRKHLIAPANVLEVGAGRSSVAPIALIQRFPFGKLILLDQSARMIEHSRRWADKGARLIVGDACSTSLAAASFQLIVSSLGDPYNSPSFWREVSRLLAKGGVCLFTTPAPEWAERFRAASEKTTAEFLLATGLTVLVRSDIPELEGQKEMITDARLEVAEIQSLSALDLKGPPSPKLLINQDTAHLPIVRGFTIVKPYKN